jgi:hypothetical protein
MLDILDLFEGEGQTATEIAAMYGVSRNAILGVVHRVRQDLAKSEAGGPAALRPENQDGGMPRRWWSKRGRAA